MGKKVRNGETYYDQIEVKTVFKTRSYDVNVRHYSVISPPADKRAFYGNKHAYSLTRETK